jgi:hypothetical protein
MLLSPLVCPSSGMFSATRAFLELRLARELNFRMGRYASHGPLPKWGDAGRVTSASSVQARALSSGLGKGTLAGSRPIAPAPPLLVPLDYVCSEVERFDARLPVAEAITPPASWFTSPAFHELDLASVFRLNWVTIGTTARVPEAGSYFTGRYCNTD